MTITERYTAVIDMVFGGRHHVDVKEESERHLRLNASGTFATFDFDELTRMVLAAHKYAIRVQVQQGGPGMMRVYLHPRLRKGAMNARHPDLFQLIEKCQLCMADSRQYEEPVAKPEVPALPAPTAAQVVDGTESVMRNGMQA